MKCGILDERQQVFPIWRRVSRHFEQCVVKENINEGRLYQDGNGVFARILRIRYLTLGSDHLYGGNNDKLARKSELYPCGRCSYPGHFNVRFD